MKDSRTKKAKIVSVILAAAMSIPLIPVVKNKTAVFADGATTKDQSNTKLCSSGISAPKAPKSKDAAWTGNYVWFGTYGNNPVKYRVLAPRTSDFGGSTMLLDSDQILFSMKFASHMEDWNSCYLKAYLNETFYDTSFTDQEKTVIKKSLVTDGMYPSSSYFGTTFGAPVYVGEKIFLLDAGEITTEKYGYTSDPGADLISSGWAIHTAQNHVKKDKSGNESQYWLRAKSANDSAKAGIVSTSGYLTTAAKSENKGVAPALNIDRRQLLFDTAVKAPDENSFNGEYKLTFIDEEIKPELPSTVTYTTETNTVRVPLVTEGNHSNQANRVSYLILSSKYAPGNANGASVMYYGEFDGTYELNYKPTFTFPMDLALAGWGKDYYVYVVVENVATGENADHLSDYASEPVEIPMPCLTVGIDVYEKDTRLTAWQGSAIKQLLKSDLVYSKAGDEENSYVIDLDKDLTADILYWKPSSFSMGLVKKLPTCSISGKKVFYPDFADTTLGTKYNSITFRFPDPKPDTVTGLKAVSAGKNKVKLTWDAVEGVEGYLVYAQKKGQYGYVGMTTKGTTFTDTKALDTEYNFYWVFGYYKNSEGKMIPGGCEKYVYAKGVCLAVTGLKASSVSGGVKLTWNASEGAEGYLVYGIHPGGSYGYIGMTTKGTTFTDKKASKTDWNFYWVFPYHKNGDTMVVGGTPKYVYGKAK